jgi:hypothetical protein
MDPRTIRARTLDVLYEQMLYLTADLPVGEISPAFESISESYQALAICALLADGDAEKFRTHLATSGQTRRYFLARAEREGVADDRRLAPSRTQAVLDALVAGDLPLARGIARRSPTDWNPNWEYEDDHCYYRFVHEIVLETPVDEFAPRLLKRFEHALEGDDSIRLEACRALAEGDGQAFAEALLGLIEEQQEAADAGRGTAMDSAFLYWARSFVSIEGLALMRLAELLDFELDRDDLPLCPVEAQLAVLDGTTPDTYAELERAKAETEGRA